MGRTTSIIISKNPNTKTHQTQTIWFGGGEIRLNGETGQYIGEYASNRGWYIAVMISQDATSFLRYSVETLSPPLTTATQAAQAVAWAWLACKALEGFAEAAAPVLELMEEEQARIEQAQYDREAAAGRHNIPYMIDEILITPFARDMWLAAAKMGVAELLKRYPDLKPEEIGDEQAGMLPNGCAEIFVIVRDVKIALIVPPNQIAVEGGGASDE